MASSAINIFFTGATGYIGGEVLGRLLQHTNASNFNITALVRNKDKAAKLDALGVGTLIASHDDGDKLEEHASKADWVIANADADHLDATKSLLRGMRRRYEATGKPTLFIHTSGTGVLHDKEYGVLSAKVYDDANADEIETLPHTQIHRNVDLEIIAADKAGYVKSYIVLPSVIYGVADGKLAGLGIQNTHSILIPLLIKASLGNGQSIMLGEGKNAWGNVHIKEVGDFYSILVDSVLNNPETPHGREGIYFLENGEHQFYQISEEIAEVLVGLGKIKTTEIKSYTREDALQAFGALVPFIAANCRGKATRARRLGWKPARTTKDMLESIKAEADTIVAA